MQQHAIITTVIEYITQRCMLSAGLSLVDESQGDKSMSIRPQKQLVKTSGAKPASLARSGVRISADLHDDARHAAEVSVRTVPAQIEYWMKMGRLFDEHIQDPQKIYDLLQGNTLVESVSIQNNTPVLTADVFSDLEESRASGALTRGIPSNGPLYDVDSKRPEAIRRANADGTVEYGQFTNGRFVADS